MNRRQFFKLSATSLSVSPLAIPYFSMATPLRKKVKITDVKTMMVRSPIAD